ncbi:MAG: FHA domain-containing protein [Myxococcota bacterium]
MRSVVNEEPRPGLWVFAHHADFGLVARLWLEAGSEPRGGTLGRHDFVDLPLPLDEGLSLRHVLFVVRRAAGVVQLTAVDLATCAGLQLLPGHAVQRVDVEGVCCLKSGAFTLFCVPSGEPVPWSSAAPSAWATLKPGRVRRHFRRDDLAPPQRPFARLTVSRAGEERHQTVSLESLRRGLLVGRDLRCGVRIAGPEVSRVHLALLEVDDEVLAVDTGSTNGLFSAGRRVRCEPLRSGQALMLGRSAATLVWELLD